jgi:beta-N-acetylhexosaminidase
VEDDLRRLGRLPALLIVALGAIGAFWALSAVGSDQRSVAQVRPITGPSAKPATKHHAKPAPAPLRHHPQAVDPPAGGSVVVHVYDQPPNSSAVIAKPPARRHATNSSGLARDVGAKIMTAMTGTYPDAGLLSRVSRGEVGGVILFGANISSRLSAAVAALQQAAQAGGNPPLLISTDQEGGPVKRLASAPPTAAPAQMSAASAGGQGLATGLALRALGINLDLAPVADVAQPANFLGARSFSSDPSRAAAAACQFAGGLRAGGVNATFKHFPGLGRASANTDTAAVSIGTPAKVLLADLKPYASCRPPLVMLSNATYPAFDAATPAVFSRHIISDLLRGQFGFSGVTISDTLSAPGVAGPTAAIRAAAAGVDILLYTDQQISARAYTNLLAAARAGQLSSAELNASAQRIHALAR